MSLRAGSLLVIGSWLLIRHSNFVIRHLAPARLTRYLTVLATMFLMAATGCSDLNWHDPGNDTIGAYPNLQPLPSDYKNKMPAARNTRAGGKPIATQPLATQASAGATTQPTGPLALSVQSAILKGLANNPDLKVQQFNPAIRKTYEQQQRAAFDPALTGSLRAGRNKNLQSSSFSSEQTSTQSDNYSFDFGLQQFFPTGTTVAGDWSTGYNDTSVRSQPTVNSRVGITVTQALLRGFGIDVNLAALRQARLDILKSRYQLRGYAQSLVQQIEDTYWDYALDQQKIKIVQSSLDIANKQLSQDKEMVKIGKLAAVELAAAKAEVALRKEDLINARSKLATDRLQLLELISPDMPSQWDRKVIVIEQPFVPVGKLDPVSAHVDVAMKFRPDLNEARLQLKQDDLQIVQTKNGLLPKLNLFITLGKSGYADSFGRSYRNLTSGSAYDASAGVNLQYPVDNRDALAKDLRAHLTRQQQRRSIDNLKRLAQVDVRSAYIEVKRTKEQIAATHATRVQQEANLRNETEKFRVGKSTSLLVAQAQRDLLSARINEVQAVADHLKALVDLFAKEGSLLARRGIKAPASQPATVEVMHEYMGD